jgi:hypothetical protein
MLVIPEGVESKVFDFELIKSKIAYRRNSPDRTFITFLNLKLIII